jgi:hypothetical protein
MSASVAIDFTAARQYLDSLSEAGHRVSVHQLVVASICRVLREFPAANARVYGGRIVRKSEVGVAMPVNLMGHPGEKRAELTLSILEKADRLSLQELSRRASEDLQKTRKGGNDHA